MLLAALVLAVLNLAVVAHPLDSEDWLAGPLGDDAYYYLSVARNAAERGEVSYDGQPTNGFQPLHLLVCMLAGELADWDVHRTPALVTWFNWGIFSLLGGALAYALGAAVTSHGDARVRGAAGALLWLSQGNAARLAGHGMETPLALVSWLAVALAYLRWSDRPADAARAAWLGAALGLVFLARNDTGFLALWVLALVGWRLVLRPRELASTAFAQRARALLACAATSAGLALPWLVSNWVRLGSPVPQSGAAEAVGSLYDHGRGVQAEAVLRAVARNLAIWHLPLDQLPRFASLAASAAILLACVAATALLLRAGGARVRTVLWAVAPPMFALALVYAALFGAPHMCARWLAPFGVAGVVLALGITDLAAARLSPGTPSRAFAALAALSLVGAAPRLWIDAERGTATNTYPMLRYLEERRAPDGERIGALQSGLAGWVLPNIGNIDGKVNARALEAIQRGAWGAWLADSSFDLLVDWDFFGYEDDPAVLAAFQREPAPDGLIALRRVQPARPAAATP
jgi:hypothetical protein